MRGATHKTHFFFNFKNLNKMINSETQPTKIILVQQGSQNKMHTMWIDFIDGSEYVKPRFVKNLSTDSEKAMQKAHEYAQKIGVDSSLVIDNTHDLNAIKKIYKWTDSMVRFGKNYGKELKDCPETFIKWIANGSPLKDEPSGEWCNHYFGGDDFCVIAQKIAVEMNLGVMEDRIYSTPIFVSVERYNRTTEYLAQQLLEKNDHYFNAGEKVKLTLTCQKITGYQSQFGYVNIYKFIDAENRVFTYKGNKRLLKKIKWVEMHEGKEFTGYDHKSLEKGHTITLSATIKHGEYQDVKSTYLQRIKIDEENENIKKNLELLNVPK